MVKRILLIGCLVLGSSLFSFAGENLDALPVKLEQVALLGANNSGGTLSIVGHNLGVITERLSDGSSETIETEAMLSGLHVMVSVFDLYVGNNMAHPTSYFSRVNQAHMPAGTYDVETFAGQILAVLNTIIDDGNVLTAFNNFIAYVLDPASVTPSAAAGGDDSDSSDDQTSEEDDKGKDSSDDADDFLEVGDLGDLSDLSLHLQALQLNHTITDDDDMPSAFAVPLMPGGSFFQ